MHIHKTFSGLDENTNPTILRIAFIHPQNTTLMMRMMSSSGEKIVSKRGKRGAAVAAASR
jgi:hypothetical protein